MIVGSNYTRRQIYDSIYEYTCEDGYYFESCGTNYGNHIFGGDVLTNKYIIKKKDDNTSR